MRLRYMRYVLDLLDSFALSHMGWQFKEVRTTAS